MQDFLKRHQGRLKLLGLGLLVIVLSACSTSSVSEPTTNNNNDERYDYVLTVDVAANDTISEIERAYEGEAVVFRPEAGFAILGLKHGEFTTLDMNAEANQEAVSSPVTMAGNDSWAGGNDSWAGGSDVWSATGDLVGGLANNATEFAQVGLSLGQALAPNLGAGVVVAVLDTGVDLTHPALQGKLTASSSWKDFVDGDTYPNDDAAGAGESNAGQGHGTAAAGIILQVAPNVQIMPVRVLHPNGGGDFTDIAAGIDWAIAQGADVLNLSLGSVNPSPTIQALLTYAASQGVYVIASTGNSGDGNVTHPASGSYNYAHGDYVVGVGSVDTSYNKSSFSTYGSDVEMVAPGEQIYSFGPGGTTMHVTGTSFATPMVAGTLALGLGEVSSLGLPLTDTATNILSGSSDASIYVGKNLSYLNQLGQGRLDVEAFMMSILGMGL
jgi:hypothetical protein